MPPPLTLDLNNENNDYTKFGMRVRFDAYLKASSNKGDFKLDAVSCVYITNRDQCSYMVAPVQKEDGLVQVDFNMCSRDASVRLVDRMKMFFFFKDPTDKQLKPICAGHIDMHELCDCVQNDGGMFRVSSNFTSNVVTVRFKKNQDFSRMMHLDLERLKNAGAMTRSVLSDDRPLRMLELMKTIDGSVKQGLSLHTNVMQDNGGPMFQSIITAHVMQGEATLYSLYHHDFDGRHNVPMWLATYLLAETLLHTAMTVEQVKLCTPSDVTKFIATYAQAPMRCRSATPYTPDTTMTEDPRLVNTARSTQLSEVFKRQFSHPYCFVGSKQHGTISNDDCEGVASLVRDLVNRLGCMWTDHREDLMQLDVYGRSKNMATGALMAECFPDDLFKNMPATSRFKIVNLALFLGEYVASGKIEAHITLVSAMGASMEGGGKEIQAHACASLNCNVADHCMSVMLEGTACMVDDDDIIGNKKILVCGQYIPVSAVLNGLTVDVLGGCSRPDTKAALHITHARGDFYRTAFCQNGEMLGMEIGSVKSNKTPTFGVDVEYLSDNGVKVYMPVTGLALEAGAYAELKQYIQDRSVEIHPPFVDGDQLRANLKWAPLAPFNGCALLQASRAYSTLMVHITTPADDAVREVVFEEQQRFANAFNEKFTHLGVMRVFASMDGVSKVLHLYVDDLARLQESLKNDDDGGKKKG